MAQEPVVGAGEAPSDLHTDIDDVASFPIEEAPVGRIRVAEALLRLREQVNAAAPRRSKKSDGTVGDRAHQSRASDHNPWIIDGGVGVVSALDITHDPDGGCDAHRIVEALRRSRDPRIKYIISNRRIASSAAKGAAPAWAWRTYTGANPHSRHAHLSVHSQKALYDAKADWQVQGAFGPVLESAEGAAAEDPMAELEYAVAALSALTEPGPDAAPLRRRLTALRDAADALLSRYDEVVGDDGGAGGDART